MKQQKKEADLANDDSLADKSVEQSKVAEKEKDQA